MVAAVGVAVLGVFCVLSVFQLAMVMSRERVVISYSVVVIAKLALVLLASKYDLCYICVPDCWSCTGCLYSGIFSCIEFIKRDLRFSQQ
jgi:hypothetical protein